VVLFRPSSVEADTRAKKIALTLARSGYEVVLLSAVPLGTDLTEGGMGQVRIVPVEVRTTARDRHAMAVASRRRHRWRLLDRTSRDEYVTRVAERRAALREPSGRGPLPPSARHAVGVARLQAIRGRWKAQHLLDRVVHRAWREWDRRRQATALLASDVGMLPELEDYATAFGPVLDRLEPDVIHAHHPLVLPTALRAARRARAAGRDCRVVYDARENFAGIPVGEQGNPRRHAVLVRQEARSVRQVDAVLTVSEPIADELWRRYQLPERPTVLLNVPVRRRVPPGPTVRRTLALPDDVPLLVYSGGVSRARGIELLVDLLGELPGIHVVLVTVPYPHPMTPELEARARDVGGRDRFHVLPPVGQDQIVRFLSDADAALHPLPGGSPNHDQALPNKLFEYQHAGLPLVVSDARLMADFVRTNALGAVFRSGDVHDLARAVGEVLAAGRPRAHEVADTFTWQGQEEALASLYRRVAVLPAGVTVQDGDFPALDVVVPHLAEGADPPAGSATHEQPPDPAVDAVLAPDAVAAPTRQDLPTVPADVTDARPDGVAGRVLTEEP
jgi:glycosyltransferase involved in cell wall biosynthesis